MLYTRRWQTGYTHLDHIRMAFLLGVQKFILANNRIENCCHRLIRKREAGSIPECHFWKSRTFCGEWRPRTSSPSYHRRPWDFPNAQSVSVAVFFVCMKSEGNSRVGPTEWIRRRWRRGPDSRRSPACAKASDAFGWGLKQEHYRFRKNWKLPIANVQTCTF